MTDFTNDDFAQTIDGTETDDTFRIFSGDVGDGNDIFRGLGGVDFIWGGLGRDSLFGGDGNDQLFGGLGDDHLDGGDGFDVASWADQDRGLRFNIGGGTIGGDEVVAIENFIGTTFADTFLGNADGNGLSGGDGDDTITGGGGNDSLSGGNGLDVIYGGKGNDNISSGSALELGKGRDLVYGGDGDDAITGSSDGDEIYGGGGNEFIVLESLLGTAGNDLCFGGAGNDLIQSAGGDDRLDGGDGTDTLNLFLKAAGVRIDLGEAVDRVDAGTEGLLRISGFENANTGIGNDRLTGTGTVNVLNSGAGNDTLSGLGGSDTLRGSAGDDSILGGAGNDSVEGGDGVDRLFGGIGADSFRFSAITHSPPDARDLVGDFVRGEDKIDLTRFFDISFDVTPGLTRLCDFSFIGGRAFSGDADEVRFKNGVVSVDTNQDGAADLAFVMDGIANMSRSDFLFD